MTSQLKITKIIQPHTVLGPFTGSFPCKNGPSHMISDEEGQKLRKTSNLTEYNTLNPFNSSFLFTNGPTDIMIITQGPTLCEKNPTSHSALGPFVGSCVLAKVAHGNATCVEPKCEKHPTSHSVLGPFNGPFPCKNRTQSHHDQ